MSKKRLGIPKIPSKIASLVASAQKKARINKVPYCVLSNGKVVELEGLMIDPDSDLKVEWVCFPQ